ncbi:hypothetical protein MPLSOD_260007 [Mesorhizobium sp. SOD10]|nr:hypothetical protein MPLSOD_260007 [Mesorhizobium sp. SOD10]
MGMRVHSTQLSQSIGMCKAVLAVNDRPKVATIAMIVTTVDLPRIRLLRGAMLDLLRLAGLL